MYKHISNLLSTIFLSLFFISCSFIETPENQSGIGGIQCKLPERTSSSVYPGVEIWHVDFIQVESNKSVFSNSYAPGEKIIVENLPIGDYKINVMGSNGETVYGKSENVRVEKNVDKSVTIILEKKIDIQFPLSNIGTIKEIKGLKQYNIFYFKENNDNYFISRLYNFYNFSQQFNNLLNTVDKSNFINSFFQGDNYELDPANKYSIEITASLDKSTLKLKNIILSIKDLDINPDGKCYNIFLSPEEFNEITTPSSLQTLANVRNKLKNQFDTNIDNKMANLGIAGSSIERIIKDNSLLLNTSDKNYKYFRRLYVYSGSLNEKIQAQLQARKSNCHFNFYVEDLLKAKKAFVQVEAMYNIKTNKITNFEIRLKDTEEIPYGNYGPGYCLNGVPETLFEMFISGTDPEYKFPENNSGNTIGLSFSSPTAKELGNNTPCSPDSNNYLYVYVEDASTGTYVTNAVQKFGDNFSISWINPGKYNVTVIGTDGDYIYSDKQTLTFTKYETANFDFSNFASTKKDVRLNNIGTIESTYNLTYSGNFYEYDMQLFKITKLYKFSNFSQDLLNAIENKHNNTKNYNMYEGYNIDNTSKCIVLETQINMADLSVENYKVSIVDPTLYQDTNTNCYMINMNQISFDDFSKGLAEINNSKNNCLALFTTGSIDTNFGTLEMDTSTPPNAIVEHEGLLLYNNGNINTRIYTRLYKYNQLQTEIKNQISGKIPNTRLDFDSTKQNFGSNAIQVEQVINYPEKTINCYNLIFYTHTSGGESNSGYKVSGLTEGQLTTFLSAPDYILSNIPGTKMVSVKMPQKSNFGITSSVDAPTDRLAFRIIKQNEDIDIFKEVNVAFNSTNEKNLEYGNYTIEIFGDDNNYIYSGKKNFTVDSSTTEVTFTPADLKCTKFDIKDKLSKFGTITKRINSDPNLYCVFDRIQDNGSVSIPMLFIYSSYNNDFNFLLTYLSKNGSLNSTYQDGADKNVIDTTPYYIELIPSVNYKNLKVSSYQLNIKNGANDKILQTFLKADDFEKLINNFTNIVKLKKTYKDEVTNQIEPYMKNLLSVDTLECINNNNLGLPSFGNNHLVFYDVLYASDGNLNQKLIDQLKTKETNAGFNIEMPGNYNQKTLIQLDIMINTNTNSVQLYRFRFHDKTLHGTNFNSYETTTGFFSLDELKQFLAGPDFVLPSQN